MNSVPEYPQWRPLGCEDKHLLDHYCQKFAPYAEATFATLLVWNDIGGCQIAQFNGNVVLRHHSCGGGYVVSMLGANQAVETAQMLVKSEGEALRLVPSYSIGDLGRTHWEEASLQVVADRDNDDYVFSTSRLAELSGNDLKGKRKRRNAFTRNYEPEQCTLDLTSTVDILAMLRCTELWLLQAADYQDEPPEEEMRGLTHLLELTARGDLWGMLGFGVRVGGELVGGSIVETHGTDTVSGVVFKASRNYPGSAEFLRSSSAAQLATLGYQWINVQQDLGIPGLREMKSAYRPISMLHKWTIQPLEGVL
jgi:hypothetical protein